jgi:hypothetical protein
VTKQIARLIDTEDMRPGDTFVELDYSDNPHGPIIVVEREGPERPQPGTFGSANVLGKGLAQGFINEDGGFSYWDGDAAQEVHVDDVYGFVSRVLRPEVTREQVAYIFEGIDDGVIEFDDGTDRIMKLLEENST